MASNAEKLLLGSPKGTPDQAQRPNETVQPDWDVPSLFQMDKPQGLKKPDNGEGKITTPSEQLSTQAENTAPTTHQSTYGTREDIYKNPFAVPRTDTTYRSPYGSVWPPASMPLRTPTTMEILNKQPSQMTAEDLKIVANNTLSVTRDFLDNTNGDHAGMAALLVRFKTEYLASKFAGNSAMVYGLSAVPLAALSGYALKHDVDGFNKSTTMSGKAYYGAASALDATALGGTALMLVPQTRSAAKTVSALSITARAVAGWTHNTFFKD
jgi:hypothetical protein